MRYNSKKSIPSYFFWLLLVLTMMFISCGGGGDEAATSNVNSQPTSNPGVKPTADAGDDQTVGERQSVRLNGSRSIDTDGIIQAYQWRQVSGPSITITEADIPEPNFVTPLVSENTELLFELTITDDSGLLDKDEVSIFIIDNSPPVADAGFDQQVLESQVVNMSGSNSYDSDGTIQAYQWRQVSGPVIDLTGSNTENLVFTSPQVLTDSTLSFELTVTDDVGLTNTDRVNIVVIENTAPVADAGDDQQVLASQVVTLDGTQSTDIDGNIVSYLWSQISGSSVVTDPNFDPASPTPFFTSPISTEKLSFRLTVTDNLGAKHTDQVDVYVSFTLFEDDFSQGLDEANWIKVDDSAGSGNNSFWIISGNALQQNNYVCSKLEGIPFDQSYHKGSYRYLNSALGLTDYRFQVEITPLTNLTGSDGNDIGIMFRYQNPDNYYRLSMNARYGFTRLEKKVGGQFTSLVVNSIGYFDNVSTEFLIDVKGSLIQVFIDNEAIFSVIDPDITSGTVALYCQDKVRFDDVLISDAGLAPRVVLSTPSAYMIATTGSSTLSALAHTTNLPDDAWVEFVLDESVSKSDTEAPFEAYFYGVSSGNHTITAVLRDKDNNELDRDSNQSVGISGGYLIAAGDSITNGSGDYFAGDNMSYDGRTVGIQGYAAGLNDKLTAYYNKPHIVFNEGIPGDRTQSALAGIDSVLDRHPQAESVLLLLGTNDVVDSVSTAVFFNNMQSIVDRISTAGLTAKVALVPPQFNASTGLPNTTINSRIQAYNNELANLVNADLGPDLFAFFMNNKGLFSDSIHPNSLGHIAMAGLWSTTLTGVNDDFFILYQLLTPALYQQNLLEVDDAFYIDESYTLRSIPSEISSGIWIMTANGDSINTSSTFISFVLDRPATVYVAYDTNNGAALPAWLSGSYANTGLQISSTAGEFDLYSRYYNGGTVVLGGNHAGGGTGQLNYFVIVKE
ncbi:MAG: PKD domain-containing protein [Pseudomonadota bacterium]